MRVAFVVVIENYLETAINFHKPTPVSEEIPGAYENRQTRAPVESFLTRQNKFHRNAPIFHSSIFAFFKCKSCFCTRTRNWSAHPIDTCAYLAPDIFKDDVCKHTDTDNPPSVHGPRQTSCGPWGSSGVWSALEASEGCPLASRLSASPAAPWIVPALRYQETVPPYCYSFANTRGNGWQNRRRLA